MATTHDIEFRKNASLTPENGETKTACLTEIGRRAKAQVLGYVISTNDHDVEVACG
jgi:hypothetical protein